MSPPIWRPTTTTSTSTIATFPIWSRLQEALFPTTDNGLTAEEMEIEMMDTDSKNLEEAQSEKMVVVPSRRTPATSSHSQLHAIRSWLPWLLSVLITSITINQANRLLFHSNHTSNSHPNPTIPEILCPTASLSPLFERDNCVSANDPSASAYNLPFHIGALFLIFGVSTLSASFPILANRFRIFRIPPSILFSIRHFGTGVLIATAFVHLLPTAFISLNNPCLPTFWSKKYQAMPGAIALAAIFLVAVVEMIFSPARRNYCDALELEKTATTATTTIAFDVDAEGGNGGTTSTTLTASSTVPVHLQNGDVTTTVPEHPSIPKPENTTSAAHGHIPFPNRNTTIQIQPPTVRQLANKAILQCFLLEAGILFHSVFIGMALSVAVGKEFIVLVIAIAFHQTFEGLALGSRISELPWLDTPLDKMKPWLMALAYGFTAPLGQAIGLATHSLYSPNSKTGLLMVGIMNAISSGLLVFASLVELLSEDFLSDASFQTLRGRRRVFACVLVFLGAFAMSLVGAWA